MPPHRRVTRSLPLMPDYESSPSLPTSRADTGGPASPSQDDGLPSLNLDLEAVQQVVRRVRRKLSPVQLESLEKLAACDLYPSLDARRTLAADLGLELKVVSVWFQNKRRVANRYQGESPEAFKKGHEEAFTPIKRTSISADPVDSEARQQRDALSDINENYPTANLGSATSIVSLPSVKGLSGLWNFMPSSSPDREELQQSPVKLGRDGSSPVLLGKRQRTLEWACSKEDRELKRARSTSDKMPAEEERTKKALRTLSASDAQSVARLEDAQLDRKINGTVPILSRSYDKDVMEVAHALIQLKQQGSQESTQQSGGV